MKRFGRLVILAMMTAALLVPGFGGTASAQDASLCDAALAAWNLNQTELGDYEIVEWTGGSGSQIVLGYGDATLSGGSGNDVLCAWGTRNTLDGGSGSDLLVAMDTPGNAFYGGSGNDSMIGYAGDFFDGGSGRNTEERLELPGLRIWLDRGIDAQNGRVLGTGWTPFSFVSVRIDFPSDGQSDYSSFSYHPMGTNADGTFDNFAEGSGYVWIWFCNFGGASRTSFTVTATDLEGVTFSQTFDTYCS